MGLIQQVNGISSNPFSVIQGIEKMGADAISQATTTASNGYVAQVNGPNKIIMDTGYFPPNTFLGPMMCDVIFYTNVTQTNTITLEVWRRDPTGYEEMVYTNSKQWYGDISPYFGNNILLANFTVNNEYRFIFKSASGNAATTTVGIDYIKIHPKHQFTVDAAATYSGVLANYGSPTNLTVWRQNVVCASAGSGGFTQGFTTGFPCTGTDVSINVTAQNTTAGGTMPFLIISAVTSTGFSVYFQNAAGSAMTGNITLHVTVTRTAETPKI